MLTSSSCPPTVHSAMFSQAVAKQESVKDRRGIKEVVQRQQRRHSLNKARGCNLLAIYDHLLLYDRCSIPKILLKGPEKARKWTFCQKTLTALFIHVILSITPNQPELMVTWEQTSYTVLPLSLFLACLSSGLGPFTNQINLCFAIC